MSVNDVNESPSIVNGSNTRNISEASAIYGYVNGGAIEVTDPDTADEHTFSIIDSVPSEGDAPPLSALELLTTCDRHVVVRRWWMQWSHLPPRGGCVGRSYDSSVHSYSESDRRWSPLAGV